MILIGMAVVAVAAVILTVVLVIRKKKVREELFEELDVTGERTPSPVPSAQPVHPVCPPGFDEDEHTRRIFDFPELNLKSYVMEMADLAAPGQIWRVNVTDRITIGKRADCTVCIPNRTVSGLHCEILLRDGKFYLRDAGSLNGTYVNGGTTKITEMELVSGTVIEMGSARLQVKILQVD